MANNATANTSDSGGPTFKTTEAAGVHTPHCNVDSLPALAAGTNNIGDVDVASLPGTAEADIAAIKTAVEILDNAISGNEMQADIVTLPSFPANSSTTAATFAQVVNTVAAAATPEALAGSTTLVESVIIQAKKGFNSANTSAVFVGFSATNDSNYLELLPGDSVTLNAPQGKKLDLNLIYIECVTAGDGVTYTSVN